MTSTGTLRVVVADDQALVRVGFCGIIAATPGFAVVGEAGNGVEAVEAARRTRPDVILMDVRMPVMDGIEATRQITRSTDVHALILTTFDLDEYVFAALRAGASGFLLKDTLPARNGSSARGVATLTGAGTRRDDSLAADYGFDRDAASGHGAPGGGHGIIGMRERVTLLGGDFSAGPLPGYGFKVSARIPLPAASA